MKIKLALNFKETNDGNLSNIAFSVVDHMDGNEYFPDPGMLIIELRETSNQFLNAMSEAFRKDLLKIAIKNNVRVILIKKLKEVGEFVKVESKGSEAALLSSGFPVFKPTDEIKLKTPTPADFIIKPGSNPGEIIMQVRRVKGARSYMYQWAPAPYTRESDWESVLDTCSKRVISNLPLGINYCFRMAAIGAHKQIVYTEIKSRYIS
jgi:hypothetical protein